MGGFFNQLGQWVPQIIGGATTISSLIQRPGPAPPSPSNDPPIPVAPPDAVPMSGAWPSEPSPSIAPPDIAGQPSPAAPPWAAGPNAQQLAWLLQALQQRQIPPLPGVSQAPALAAAPPAAPPAPALAPAADGLALLRLILANPQFQQALAGGGPGGMPAPAMSLPMPPRPGTAQPRRTRIPIGAVLNAVALLAGQSLNELSEQTAEDAPDVPEYLVGEDGEYIVDPSDPPSRASLVAHYFRVSDAIRRRQPASAPRPTPPSPLTDADAWARDAGFPM